MGEVLVRPFCDADAPALRRLAGELVAAAQAVPEDPGRDVVFVAEVEGHPAGYMAVREDGRSLVIDQLIVAPASSAANTSSVIASAVRRARSPAPWACPW